MMQNSALRTFWIFTLLLVPVTTPGFIPLGATVARPLSIIPATIVFVLALTHSHRLSATLLSRQACFAILFLFTSTFSFLAFQIHYGSSNISDYVRGTFSVLVGFVFYFTFLSMNKSDREINVTEKYLLIALSFTIFIAFFQLLVDKLIPSLAPVVNMLDYLFADREQSFKGRYNGLAYEPSWLASQITVLMLPLLCSRWIAEESLGVLKLSFIRVRIETLYLLVAFAGIVISGSRTAVVASLVILFTAMVTVFYGSRKINRRWVLKKVLLMTITIIAIAIGSLTNEYISSTTLGLGSDSLLGIILNTHSAPRVASWNSSLNVFMQFPFTGVGLGNAYTFFYQNIPEWAQAYPEVQSWASDNLARPNPKNMFLKLLSETGLIGLIIFVLFVYSNCDGRNRELRYRVLRNTGLVALFFDYLSLDSFALCSQWFLMGFIYYFGKMDRRIQV